MIHVLDKTQTEVYLEFSKCHPEIKVSQRMFEKLKPFYVRPVREKDSQTCCCRYHVETRSVFKSCMAFRRRLVNDNTPGEQNDIDINLSDIADSTLCENSQDRLSCLNWSCSQCGIYKLKLLPVEMDSTENAPKVSWEKYEYVNVDLKNEKSVRKLILVKKMY